MKNKNTKDVLIISLKLLVICAIVATIVAAVNMITAPTIALNLKLSTANTLTEIYKNDPAFSSYFTGDTAFEITENQESNEYVVKNNGEIILSCSDAEFESISDDITNLYVLSDKDGNSLGYCIAIEPMGYKDVVKMLVSIDSDGIVKNVKIVSISDTKNIGTRVVEDNKPPSDKNGNKGWFLEQFIGLGGKDVNADDIQPIAKATKTSKPVVEAVKTAVEQIKNYIASNGGVE